MSIIHHKFRKYIGQVLNNGAIVLCQKRDIVLAHWKKGDNLEFVTWCVDNNGNAFWGCYFDELHKAILAFKKRTGDF